ncbi:MAG: DNA polymerase III subunit psi [Polynucleobacter sp.]|nr:DNA polymerase III subunit psi [Polynucleobacter sp.]
MNPAPSNNASMRSSFLKEMGITEWVDRSGLSASLSTSAVPQSNTQASPELTANPSAHAAEISGRWIFIGTKPQGDAFTLFQNIVRALGLPNDAWAWQDQKASIDALIESSTVPLVAIAFGAASAQRLTGENVPLTELRGAIHSLMHGETEVPLIATLELAQVLAKPQEKALLWEDLLLARSVLQSL